MLRVSSSKRLIKRSWGDSSEGRFPKRSVGEDTISLREEEDQNSLAQGQILTLDSTGMVAPGVLPTKPRAFQCLVVTVWVKSDLS